MICNPHLENNTRNSFEDKLNILFNINDYFYSLYSTYEDPISGKISDLEREEIIQKAYKVGYELANEILQTNPNKSVIDYIKENDIELVVKEEKENTRFVYFGTYETGGTITLFKGNILKSEDVLEDKNINWITVKEIYNIILAHELFHYYEEIYPNLYTNTKEIHLWKFGPYRHRSKLICPSEIAAMSFTKQLLDLKFNPSAINYLLYSSIDKKTGEDFYKKMTELNKKEK